jgi:hypothetical protein
MGHPVAGNGRVEAISRGLADATWVAQIATTSCEGTKSPLPKKECINPLQVVLFSGLRTAARAAPGSYTLLKTRARDGESIIPRSKAAMTFLRPLPRRLVGNALV